MAAVYLLESDGISEQSMTQTLWLFLTNNPLNAMKPDTGCVYREYMTTILR